MFEELIKDYKYKIEIHSHTSPASGCSEIPPEELVNTYKKLGCGAVAITNHFTSGRVKDDTTAEQSVALYMDDFNRAKAEGDKIGIHVIFGMELRFSENENDYLLYGADEKDAIEIYGLLNGGLANFREKYTNPRSLLIQAHPFRNGMTQMDSSLLDGIEAFNMHPHHNSRVSVAAKYSLDNNMLATCGTDFHHRGHEGLGLMLTKTLPTDSYELAELLRTRDYLFDVGGYIVFRP